MVLSVQADQRPLQTLRAVSSAGLAVLCWHHLKIRSYFNSLLSAYFSLTYHNITDAKLCSSQPSSTFAHGWLLCYQLFSLQKHLFLYSIGVYCSYSFIYLYWNALLEWGQVSNWCERLCTTALHLLLFIVCQYWGKRGKAGPWGSVSCVLW